MVLAYCLFLLAYDDDVCSQGLDMKEKDFDTVGVILVPIYVIVYVWLLFRVF